MIRRIVSGGQTGADRGGLDAAIELGIEHGGWCPKGRRAEDGIIPAQYDLREAKTARYEERTDLNVRDSDGTVIFHRGKLAGGSRRTAATAHELGKPHLIVRIERMNAGALFEFLGWMDVHAIEVLNVAGSRESKSPGIEVTVKAFLLRALAPMPYDVPEEERLSHERDTEMPLAAEAEADYPTTRRRKTKGPR